MTARGLVLEFSSDDGMCRVCDEEGRPILLAGVRGELPAARKDRIARLVSDLVGECQEGQVVIAPFNTEGKPS